MKKISCDYRTDYAEKIISAFLVSGLRKHPMPVVICIGSDRVTGDCLGPLVGRHLTKEYNVPAYVYGTLENTVTAANLVETLQFVEAKHKGSKIVVVDASVGTTDSIGILTIARGGILPGSGCGKNLPKTGDFSVTAVVTQSAANAYAMLQNTKLALVYEMSEKIAAGLKTALEILFALNTVGAPEYGLSEIEECIKEAG